MFRLFLVSSLALLLAPRAFAEDPPAPSLDELIALLRSRFQDEREQGVAQLVKRGPEVIERVAPLIHDRDARVQRACIDVLCRLGTPESLKPMVALLAHKDPAIRQTIRDTLVKLGKGVRPILDAEREAQPGLAAEIEEIYNLITATAVEAHFRKQITSQGNSGFYAGQYAPLKELGEDVVPVLVKMSSQADYPWTAGPEYAHYYRDMAINALGEIGDPELALPELQRLANDRSFGRSAAFAMYKLGDKTAVEKLESEAKSRLDQLPDHEKERVWTGLAEIYARVNEQEKALTAYEESIKLGSGNEQIARYNMACAYSALGRKAEGIASLRMAVNLGYDNAEWLVMDRDLDNLRAEPEFQSILERLKEGRAPRKPGPGPATD